MFPFPVASVRRSSGVLTHTAVATMTAKAADGATTHMTVAAVIVWLPQLHISTTLLEDVSCAAIRGMQIDFIYMVLLRGIGSVVYDTSCLLSTRYIRRAAGGDLHQRDIVPLTPAITRTSIESQELESMLQPFVLSCGVTITPDPVRQAWLSWTAAPDRSMWRRGARPRDATPADALMRFCFLSALEQSFSHTFAAASILSAATAAPAPTDAVKASDGWAPSLSVAPATLFQRGGRPWALVPDWADRVHFVPRTALRLHLRRLMNAALRVPNSPVRLIMLTILKLGVSDPRLWTGLAQSCVQPLIRRALRLTDALMRKGRQPAPFDAAAFCRCAGSVKLRWAVLRQVWERSAATLDPYRAFGPVQSSPLATPPGLFFLWTAVMLRMEAQMTKCFLVLHAFAATHPERTDLPEALRALNTAQGARLQSSVVAQQFAWESLVFMHQEPFRCQLLRGVAPAVAVAARTAAARYRAATEAAQQQTARGDAPANLDDAGGMHRLSPPKNLEAAVIAAATHLYMAELRTQQALAGSSRSRSNNSIVIDTRPQLQGITVVVMVRAAGVAQRFWRMGVLCHGGAHSAGSDEARSSGEAGTIGGTTSAAAGAGGEEVPDFTGFTPSRLLFSFEDANVFVPADRRPAKRFRHLREILYRVIRMELASRRPAKSGATLDAAHIGALRLHTAGGAGTAVTAVGDGDSDLPSPVARLQRQLRQACELAEAVAGDMCTCLSPEKGKEATGERSDGEHSGGDATAAAKNAEVASGAEMAASKGEEGGVPFHLSAALTRAAASGGTVSLRRLARSTRGKLVSLITSVVHDIKPPTCGWASLSQSQLEQVLMAGLRGMCTAQLRACEEQGPVPPEVPCAPGTRAPPPPTGEASSPQRRPRRASASPASAQRRRRRQRRRASLRHRRRSQPSRPLSSSTAAPAVPCA